MGKFLSGVAVGMILTVEYATIATHAASLVVWVESVINIDIGALFNI